MFLPPALARRSLYPEMRGLTALGPDGNVRHDWFVCYRNMHPANQRSWDADELGGIFWEIELQQMHEGVFTVRYILTALLNFHRKMAYWSNPELVAQDENGKETMLIEPLAELYLHESIVKAMKEDGLSPLLWPDTVTEASRQPERDPVTDEALCERLRFRDLREEGLRYEVAYLDKLDDILRDNALEGANMALFNAPSARELPKVEFVDPLIVIQPVWPRLPPVIAARPDAHEMAEKSVTRPTTHIHMQDEYGDWYPEGEVQMA